MTREPVQDEDEPEDFTPLGTVPEPIEILPPEVARSGYLVYRAKNGFEAAVPIAVMKRCVEWGRRAEPNEWFGLVVGKLCEHGGRTHVVVLGVVPDPDAKGRPHAVETTPESEFKTRTSARLLYPDGIVLGWVHGHIRHGVRFSATDRATQRTWSQPHSLGIVVDPWTAERLSVYRGPNAERLELVEVSSLHDVELPRAPSLARRARTRIVSGVRERWRAVTWLAAAMAVAMAAVGAWQVHARLAALEADSVVDQGLATLTVLSETQDRLHRVEQNQSVALPALEEQIRLSCRIITDNSTLIRDESVREILVRSCSFGVSDTDSPGSVGAVCAPVDDSIQGDR